jgi:hypothetical protein
MAKGKFVPDTREDVSALSLAELNQRIIWAKWKLDNAEKASERRAASEQLKSLEAIREERHGIPASRR